MNDIGKQICAYRKWMGMSQGNLAKLSNHSVSYISRLEGGHLSPLYKTILEIASRLGLELVLKTSNERSTMYAVSILARAKVIDPAAPCIHIKTAHEVIIVTGSSSDAAATGAMKLCKEKWNRDYGWWGHSVSEPKPIGGVSLEVT